MHEAAKYLCGFREGFSTQNSLFRVLEMLRKTIDQSGIVGVVLMDLSKAYDLILIAKWQQMASVMRV